MQNKLLVSAVDCGIIGNEYGILFICNDVEILKDQNTTHLTLTIPFSTTVNTYQLIAQIQQHGLSF